MTLAPLELGAGGPLYSDAAGEILLNIATFAGPLHPVMGFCQEVDIKLH
jgi:hypothetical protein